jgi:23S rRNA (adenine2503-C2)-methyltransferase
MLQQSSQDDAGLSTQATLAALDAQSAAAPIHRTHLLGHTLEGLEALFAEMGQPRFRARQLYTWLFAHRATDFSTMLTLPKTLRAAFAEQFDISRPVIDSKQVSQDGTRKYRFVAADNTAFEAVYIPSVGGLRTNTLCISSQSGCAVGCKFCFTASLRRNRNLAPHEIVGQVLAVRDDVAPLGEDAKVTNIVFMGMGEPLLNYANVTQAGRVLLEPLGMGFSSRRVTISTSGIVPRIYDLGRDLPVQLAISLNATTDEVRTKIMPINKKWPLAELLAAMKAYPLAPRRRITVEYVMLGGLNDTLADARRLITMLREIPHKLNLLPLNPHDRTEFTPPSAETVRAFQNELRRAGCNALIRTPRGQDIAAACGQLGETVSPAA